MLPREIPIAHRAHNCTGCSHVLPPLPIGARFCPSCGQPLNLPTNPRGLTTFPTPFSAVIRGYASALHRLGQRHQFDRNLDEAYRCYRKAARLGHPESFIQLARSAFDA